MLIGFSVGPQDIAALLGLAFGGWGLSRTGAIQGWKSVAEARKERIQEIEAAQARAEEREASLLSQISDLERRPDLSAVMRELTGIREALDDIRERWG